MWLKMPDIVIYTNPETLEHKKNPGKGILPYWEFKRRPKDDVWDELREGEGRLYFAVKGIVAGYFELMYVDSFNYESDEIAIMPNSWVLLKKPVPTNPFEVSGINGGD